MACDKSTVNILYIGVELFSNFTDAILELSPCYARRIFIIVPIYLEYLFYPIHIYLLLRIFLPSRYVSTRRGIFRNNYSNFHR